MMLLLALVLVLMVLLELLGVHWLLMLVIVGLVVWVLG